MSRFVPPCKTTKFIFSVTACMFMHVVVMSNFAVTQAMKTKDILIQQLEEKLRILSQQYKAEHDQTRREHQQTKMELQQARRELEALRDEHSKCRTIWIVPRHQVTVLDTPLGGGAWGYVREGSFKGQQVAVKCIHHHPTYNQASLS